MPTGVRLRSESDIRNRSIAIEDIVERVQRKNSSGVNVFLIDACRDAPVESYSRSINLTGLAPMIDTRQPVGSFIGFSTSYGDVALDGQGRHSPFAGALLASLETAASAQIELFYKTITDRVYQETDGKQFPIQESKITGQHCIIKCTPIGLIQPVQRFGELTVNTKPSNATVCYLIDSWNTPNCGKQTHLPINVPVRLTVKAKGYKTYTATTQVAANRQQLTVTLDPNGNRTLKIVGVVAGVIVAGALLSGGSDSGSESNTDGTVTVTIPTLPRE